VFAVDFGAVQVGSAALRTLPSRARIVSVAGVGFSASSSPRGVVVVYEPYEPNEEGTGRLVLRIGSRLVHIPLRGHGIDTLRPSLAVMAPRTVIAGRALMIRFSAADNDLVATCVVAVNSRTTARLPWPVTSFRWLVPAGVRGAVRITVRARDRTGNTATVTRTVRVQPKP
jgi:hypothetical protein